MSESEALLRSIEEALGLLQDRAGPPAQRALVTQPLSSLLEKCQQTSMEIAARPPEPIRTIHHFACTGGTLFSKCLAVMPNTQLLSEVDPLSPLMRSLVFAPSDLILHLQHGRWSAGADVLGDVFLAGLQVLYDRSNKNGTRLVLRDHTHSHFCTGAKIPDRVTFQALIAQRFPTLSVVTVRHPLDSFLSLKFQGWIQFSPQTFDEYCKRYLVFLDAYQGGEVFKYEDFVTDTDKTLAAICAVLQLPFMPDVLDLLSVVGLTGDSGRGGLVIEKRARRPVPEDVAAECLTSSAYTTLCVRLGYDPDSQAQ